MKNLVLVESPAKARTIEKFLGSDFFVRATYGHIRDLPKSELGIDIEHDFKPKYIIPTKSKKTVGYLKDEAQKADALYLATDLDREGEAIAWHVIQALDLNKSTDRSPKSKDRIKRIRFYEITKEAIQAAVKIPESINPDLVDAQQARRILDRLVGYNLSPLLWKKVKRGLSAGRVQSVVLRLIVDREKEIEDFKPEEYWEIEAELTNRLADRDRNSNIFTAKLIKVDDKKAEIKNKKEADKIVADLKKSDFKVLNVEKKEVKKFPAPPFITSTLQQEAARKLGFSAKKTMVLAQQLYEGIELGSEGSVGLITYMRTDSFHIAEQALASIRNLINKKFGKEYLTPTPRIFKKKVKGAQEAHEAIRPTYIQKELETIKKYLAPDQLKLYSLIWKRTMASQMAEAIFDQTTIDIKANSQKPKANSYLFRASGSKIKFPGFINVYLEGGAEKQKKEKEEKVLPELKVGEKLILIKLIPSQHFTEPPARYTEAMLIKALEEQGIGRPSTYAPILSTIQDRGYVTLIEKRFHPQEIGRIVDNLLRQHFPDVINIQFTAKMEEELDEIASGETKWVPVVREFWVPFEKDLKEKHEEIEKVELPVKETKEKCEKCGKPMVIKQGRYGEFMACSGWPECKNTKTIIKSTGTLCPECGGEIVERRTKKGKIFYGCENYPSCKFATWGQPAKNPCPKCQSLMIVLKNKVTECTHCEYKETLKE